MTFLAHGLPQHTHTDSSVNLAKYNPANLSRFRHVTSLQFRLRSRTMSPLRLVAIGALLTVNPGLPRSRGGTFIIPFSGLNFVYMSSRNVTRMRTQLERKLFYTGQQLRGRASFTLHGVSRAPPKGDGDWGWLAGLGGFQRRDSRHRHLCTPGIDIYSTPMESALKGRRLIADVMCPLKLHRLFHVSTIRDVFSIKPKAKLDPD